MYRVAIKDSAIETTARVADAVEAGGTVREFASRDAAERFAAGLSAGSGAVRIQSAAPQDPAPVDAYLVPDAQREEFTPVECDTRGTTFPVGANTYGAIGLGLVYCSGHVSPALAHHFAEEVPPRQRGRVREVEMEPRLPRDVRDDVSWAPDLGITVSHESRTAETYFAEVKSGNASFERNQREDMRAVAADHGVLTIRVDLAELPDRYTVRIDAVEPDE